MNVVGYIRVSTQGQAKDGYSLKYQEDEIKAYCEERGLNLIHIFRDEGILSIPSSLLLKAKQHVKNRAIKLTKVDETNFIVSFVDCNANIVQSTIPIDYERALFIAFKKVYMLYLFEQEVKKLLEMEEIKSEFSDKEISIFLS
ncbi:hypothetical protein J2S13_002739 [Oikeobacillus pervagus]|uniref:Resolvase/invertase-type recombinase catalytic domain-containing protein n=1 Tax=Oikeobacillus pervagus TaxID=1325931 RepID=A0AAJ1WK77_9BACI|nr:hypothetical protein [Oikeobacillus pervagus]